jgi:hypothetical protein
MNKAIMSDLNNIYVSILKEGRKQYALYEDDRTIKAAQNLESYSTYLSEMNEKLEAILVLTEKFANEFLEKATETRKFVDLNDKYEGDPSKLMLINKEVCHGLSWADMTERDDIKEKVISDVNKLIKNDSITKKEYEHTPILYKSLTSIYKNNIGFNFQIPIINKLNEMPSTFYWYNGDKTNPPGIYSCLSRGFYIRVPLPNVIDSTQNYTRTGTVRCKHNNPKDCYDVRLELSKRHNSNIRECNFAHEGDTYTKLGTSFRCPGLPRFGNHTYMKEDLSVVSKSDIKIMLMYASSDMLLTSLWFQKNKHKNSSNITFNNIDIC